MHALLILFVAEWWSESERVSSSDNLWIYSVCHGGHHSGNSKSDILAEMHVRSGRDQNDHDASQIHPSGKKFLWIQPHKNGKCSRALKICGCCCLFSAHSRVHASILVFWTVISWKVPHSHYPGSFFALHAHTLSVSGVAELPAPVDHRIQRPVPLVRLRCWHSDGLPDDHHCCKRR